MKIKLQIENHSGVEVEDIKRTNSREYLKWDDEILLSNQISSKSSLSKTFNHNKNNPVIKGIKAEKNGKFTFTLNEYLLIYYINSLLSSEEENTNKEKYIITHTKNQHSWSVNFEEQKEGDRQFSRTTKGILLHFFQEIIYQLFRTWQQKYWW